LFDEVPEFFISQAIKLLQNTRMEKTMIPRLIAETDRWWVVEKPSGWLTIPGRQGLAGPPVLVDWLSGVSGCSEQGRRPFVVHRIDRETSGLVLFAKTAESHAWACSAFENRKVAKRYDALIGRREGTGPEQEWIRPLSRPLLRLDSPIEGKPSVTQVEIKKRYSEGSLAWVRARIFSGRRHQIRIHLSEIGYPLMGDLQYGGQTEVTEGLTVNRVALHASELELPGGEKYLCPLPADFVEWLSILESKV
jgi:23S rRNA-/tRNA-specific pseudouridylate synthase